MRAIQVRLDEGQKPAGVPANGGGEKFSEASATSRGCYLARASVPLLLAALPLQQGLLPARAQPAHCADSAPGVGGPAGDPAGGAAPGVGAVVSALQRPPLGPEEEVRVRGVQVGVRPVRAVPAHEGGPPRPPLHVLSQAFQKGRPSSSVLAVSWNGNRIRIWSELEFLP